MESRIESIGYEVGYRLVERTCQRRWMGGDQLEAIKFVCKDLWSEASFCPHQSLFNPLWSVLFFFFSHQSLR